MNDYNVGIAALALYLYSEFEDEEKKRKRGSQKGRRWSRDWLCRRKLYTHENLLNDLRLTEPLDFKNCLRLNSETFDRLLELVTPFIIKKNTNMREAIPPSQRLSATLLYYASGLSFERLKFITCISPQSLSNIILETSDAIIQVLRDYIKLPETKEEWEEVASEYLEKWNFPHCVGAIDGKHVDIRKPENSGSTFYNYKGRFSIVLMGLVNAQHEFLMVDVGMNGRISDGGVLHHSAFGKAFYDYKLHFPPPAKLLKSKTLVAPYVIVADDAFMLHSNMMKPYPHTSLKKEEKIFNKRLSRARHTIEDAFGILNSRFEIFHRPINMEPEKAATIVTAICYLHNFLCRHQRPSYVTGLSSVNPETGELIHGECRVTTLQPLFTCKARNVSEVAKDIRLRFTTYFSDEDERPWLYKL